MPREPREVWVRRIERLQDSDLNAKEFAAELGVNHQTLLHWKYRLAREQRELGGRGGNNRRAEKRPAVAGSRYSLKNRQEIVKAFRRSGMTRRAFCEGHGVNVGTLSGWLHKMRRPDSAWRGQSGVVKSRRCGPARKKRSRRDARRTGARLVPVEVEAQPSERQHSPHIAWEFESAQGEVLRVHSDIPPADLERVLAAIATREPHR